MRLSSLALSPALTCSAQFEIRCALALAKKPSEKDSAPAQKKDPFAPPYEAELLVAEDTVKEDEQDGGESFVVLVSSLACWVTQERAGAACCCFISEAVALWKLWPCPLQRKSVEEPKANSLLSAAQQVLRYPPSLPPCHHQLRTAVHTSHAS